MLNSSLSGTAVLDEDAMGSDSDTKVATQQSIKAYVDGAVAGVSGLPSGTKMYFYQNTAPTAWTIDGAVADTLLSVKGGAAAYNAAGGSQAGTWTVAGLTNAAEATHTHTGPSHTHTGPSHVHAAGAHTHTMVNEAQACTNASAWARIEGMPVVSGGRVELWGTGGFGSVSHNVLSDVVPAGAGNVGSGGTAATGASGTAATAAGASHNHTISSAASWRPLAAIGIICTKD